MATTTPNLGLTLPTPDVDTGWGTTLNTDFTQLDDIFAANGSGTGVGIRVGSAKTMVMAGTMIIGAGDATSSPSTATIRGAAVSSGTSNTTGPNLTIDAGNGTGSGGSGDILFRTSPPGSPGTQTNTFEYSFVIANTGNVGIGTTGTTGRKLAVVNDRTENSDGILLATYNGATFENVTVLNYDGNKAVFGNNQNNPLTFITDNTERMRIDSDGALGFGGANYGTAGQVLTSAGNSAVPAWGDIEALTAYNSESFSTPTEVTFTGIASNAESLQIVFHKVKPSVSNQNILIQLGTGSGGTLAYATTGYDTYSINSASSAATDVTSGFPVKTGVTDAEYTGIITISRMYGDLWDCSYSIVNTGTTKSSIIGGGSKTLSANLTAIKVKLASGGNFTSGNVRLMYLR